MNCRISQCGFQILAYEIQYYSITTHQLFIELHKPFDYVLQANIYKETYLYMNFLNFILHKIKNVYKILGIEGLFLLGGLIILACINLVHGSHFTICPLANLGLDFCPGCGLGESISLIFRGKFSDSFSAHPLGFIALIIIPLRIFTLIKSNRFNYK